MTPPRRGEEGDGMDMSLHDEREFAALRETFTKALPCVGVVQRRGAGGSVLVQSEETFVALKGDDVVRFFAAHGDTGGVDVTSRWGAIAHRSGSLALLTITIDSEGEELRLAFPLPEAFAFIEGVAREGELVLVNLDSGVALGLNVATDIGAVRTVGVVSKVISDAAQRGGEE
jgi:hypothetical protein